MAGDGSTDGGDGGTEGMRLQKYLSRAGVSSRRAAEGLMTQGRVRVNGRVVTRLGTRVRPGRDRVEVDGSPVEPEAVRWVMLHKPAGTVTTASDPEGRPTVYGLLPDRFGSLSYVGRLDYETEGLLLLSNDGDVVHGLLHPSFEVDREYLAGVVGVPTEATLARLTEGVELEDGPAAAETARVDRREGEDAALRLVLREGRNREVRRLCEAVGHPVRWLRRVRFGPVSLGGLGRGEWRELTAAEVAALRERAGRAPRRTTRGRGGR